MALSTAKIEENLSKLAALTKKDLVDIHEIERHAIARFKGQINELESAIGMLHMGVHFGWRPLVIIHSKRTLRKYEDILGINIREYFPEEGPSADRSLGYSIAKKLDNFWKAVSGDTKDDRLREHRKAMG